MSKANANETKQKKKKKKRLFVNCFVLLFRDKYIVLQILIDCAWNKCRDLPLF